MAGAFKWCPSCGAEYHDHVVECSDCFVALVDELPEIVGPGELSTDHSLAEWELTGWPDTDLRSLFAMLSARDLDHEWDARRQLLKTNHLDEQEVDELVALFDEPSDVAAVEGIDNDDELPASSRGNVASLGRRFAGFVVDQIVIALVGGFARAALWGSFIDRRNRGFGFELVGMVFAFAYHFVLVAWSGRTLGKAVCNTRVVSYTTGRKPSALEAFLRAAAPAAVSALPFVGVVGIVAMYGAIAVDTRERRGLHDRLAGTVVIESS